MAASLAAMMSVSAAASASTTVAVADPMMGRMTALFEDVCLRTFPDDAAVDRRMATIGAKPLTAPETRVTLLDDPGRGWAIQDGDRTALLFLELPPYHACSVRWPMAAGAIDLSGYNAAIARYAGSDSGFKPVNDYDTDREGIHIHATGVSRDLTDGSAESLFIFDQHVSDAKRRANGETGVMLRFVHQIKSPD